MRPCTACAEPLARGIVEGPLALCSNLGKQGKMQVAGVGAVKGSVARALHPAGVLKVQARGFWACRQGKEPLKGTNAALGDYGGDYGGRRGCRGGGWAVALVEEEAGCRAAGCGVGGHHAVYKKPRTIRFHPAAQGVLFQNSATFK